MLHFSNGEKVETTGEHPFYIAGRRFVLAGRLAPGMSSITRANSEVKIVKIETHWERAPIVYNFTVEGFHTYFMSKTGIWVHNGPDEKDNY